MISFLVILNNSEVTKMTQQPQELFKPEQMIKWRDDLDQADRGVVNAQNLGDGPFQIYAVEDVPDRCTCGAQMVDEDGHPHACFYDQKKGYGRSLRQTVGHPQWVTLGDGNKPLTHEVCGKQELLVFSGVFFTAV